MPLYLTPPWTHTHTAPHTSLFLNLVNLKIELNHHIKEAYTSSIAWYTLLNYDLCPFSRSAVLNTWLMIKQDSCYLEICLLVLGLSSNLQNPRISEWHSAIWFNKTPEGLRLLKFENPYSKRFPYGIELKLPDKI